MRRYKILSMLAALATSLVLIAPAGNAYMSRRAPYDSGQVCYSYHAEASVSQQLLGDHEYPHYGDACDSGNLAEPARRGQLVIGNRHLGVGSSFGCLPLTTCVGAGGGTDVRSATAIVNIPGTTRAGNVWVTAAALDDPTHNDQTRRHFVLCLRLRDAANQSLLATDCIYELSTWRDLSTAVSVAAGLTLRVEVILYGDFAHSASGTMSVNVGEITYSRIAS